MSHKLHEYQVVGFDGGMLGAYICGIRRPLFRKSRLRVTDFGIGSEKQLLLTEKDFQYLSERGFVTRLKESVSCPDVLAAALLYCGEGLFRKLTEIGAIKDSGVDWQEDDGGFSFCVLSLTEAHATRKRLCEFCLRKGLRIIVNTKKMTNKKAMKADELLSLGHTLNVTDVDKTLNLLALSARYSLASFLEADVESTEYKRALSIRKRLLLENL